MDFVEHKCLGDFNLLLDIYEVTLDRAQHLKNQLLVIIITFFKRSRETFKHHFYNTQRDRPPMTIHIDTFCKSDLIINFWHSYNKRILNGDSA